MTRRLILLLTTFVLVLSACAAVNDTTSAQGESAFALTPTSIAAAPSGTAQGAGDGSTSEGIEVHGSWTIEVRNPDGSQAEYREFENALTPVGSELLANILTSALSPGRWFLTFSGINGPCNPAVCVVAVSPVSGIQGVYDNGNIDGNLIGFSLEGSYLVDSDGEIGVVSTRLGVCASGVAPAACTETSDFRGFTVKGLDPDIPVGANQTVYIKVEISFS